MSGAEQNSRAEQPGRAQQLRTGNRVQPVAAADGWVEAAPFRAHLRHLMAVAELSPATVAVLVGISPSLAHRLLHGRGGRALKRINPDTARKLLRVTAADARAVRRRTVPSEAAVRHLRQLQAAGWCQSELAQLLGLSATAFAALVSGSEPSCTQLVALRAQAEVSLSRTPLPLEPSSASRAA